MAAYARQKSDIFPRPVVELCLELTDVGDRGQEYSKSQSTYTAQLVFNLFRGWLLNFFRK